jgi:hypothetical protein
MNAQHERILSIIADLAGESGNEVDEFSVAAACGAIPDRLPRHSWVNHPCRGELLQVLTSLDQGKFIYVTKRGYWGLHLTQRGYQFLDALAEQSEDHLVVTEPVIAPIPHVEEELAWQAPRSGSIPSAPRHDHFYSTLALAIAGLGALLIFAFGQSTYSPLARESAAASGNATPSVPIILPPPPTLTATVTIAPAVTPTARTFIVANTDGEGVFLRQAPKIGNRLAVLVEMTALQEIGPEQTLEGATWRHVRAPDGTEGYVPAQYTTLKP